MIIFSLLMITISGIAAIPYGKSMLSSIDGNHTNSDFGNLARIKRSDDGVTLTGDKNSFTYSLSDSGWNVFGTFLSLPSSYYHSQFKLTRDLNYKTWDDLLSHYTHAACNKKIHIHFSRRDGEGRKVDMVILPDAIEFSKIQKTGRNVEEFYGKAGTFYIPTGPTSVQTNAAQRYEDLPFGYYRQKLFDESIWVGAAKVNTVIEFSSELFTKDSELILQLIFKVTPAVRLSTSGFVLHVENYDQLVLK